MSKTKDLATILKSAICRTKVRHRPAPSKFYFPGLSTSSTFDPRLFPVSEVLQNSFNVILKEYKDLRSISKESDYANEENQLHKGRWDWNTYISQGTRDATFASQCPKTVELLESMSFPRLMSAHNGPCNLRIRCHFPLIVPQGDCGMQVGDEIVRWVPGQPVFFDDCYEHKVWNNTEEERVVLLFDIWHPELHSDEIEAIQDMFQRAKEEFGSK